MTRVLWMLPAGVLAAPGVGWTGSLEALRTLAVQAALRTAP